MTTDTSNTSPNLPDASADHRIDAGTSDNAGGSGSPPASPPPGPPRRRWGRLVWRALAGLLGFVLVVLVLLAAGLVWVVHTDRGTRVAWQAATKILAPKLSGTIEGGTLQNGVRLRDVRWRDAGTEIRIDRVAGRWRLDRAPWKLTLDYLRVGTLDVRPGPPKPDTASGPPSLPGTLTSPLQIDVRDVRVEKILVHEARAVGGADTAGASTTDIRDLAFHGSSDGRHHRLVLDNVTTPFGGGSARLSVDGGARPYAATGDVRFTGAVSGQPISVTATLAGSLEQMIVDADASGMKLAGKAHIEATPFDRVPLRLVTIAADHLNPQVFSATAPDADLKIDAQLRPVSGANSGANSGADSVSAPLVVAGTVSIVNAIPGAIDAQRLPLIDAQAVVRLDAATQEIQSLKVRLVRDAMLTGQGRLSGSKGQFDLNVARLDLHAVHGALRATQLSGPLTLGLDGTTQTVNARLEDPAAAISVRANIKATPQQTQFDDVQLATGKGRVQLSGALQRDTDASFAFKADARDFDPLSLMSVQQASPPARGRGRGRASAPSRRIEARVSGAFTATGTLAPEVRAKVGFALRDSVYDGLPMTGTGTVQVAGTRLLPSKATLSVAGNDVVLNGSFGTPRDRLEFSIDATQLDRLGFGLAGQLIAKGDVTGSIAHPNVSAHYQANQLVFGDTRVGHAEGDAQLRDGANGALNASIDAGDVSAPGLSLQTLVAKVAGTRARHTIDATAQGSLRGNRLNATIAAQGGLTESPAGTGWKGTISQLQNRGVPNLTLESPVTVAAAPGRIELSATRLVLEGATLELGATSYLNGQIRSTGTIRGVDTDRMLALQAEMTGKQSKVVTDLVFDGDWDVAIGTTATGHIAVRRRSGDLQVNTGRGPAALGLDTLSARVDFTNGNRARLQFSTQAARLGVLSADVQTTLVNRDGLLTVGDDSPLSGKITADLPSLRTTGGLFGPTYILDGALALRLSVAGDVAKPRISGTLEGQKLAATLVDQGIQLRDGVVDVAINENVVDFHNVTFHGGKGTLSATGKVQLDADNPDVTARIVADKLEIFAAPDRQLSVSGQASVANAGTAGGVAIDGKFVVDKALFDLPQTAAPSLGDDVVIVRSNGRTEPAMPPKRVAGAEKPVGPFAPRANVVIDLGNDFRFRGAGADLGLRGALKVVSAPNRPLAAEGNINVIEGSTYEAFGRKLGIETGYFTFNGPIDNPSINLLAMRRNQEVEAGVRVRGTLKAPNVGLVSEPSVPDNEKLSWLLFGHGSDSGQNAGQENTMSQALALLGSAGGKRIAQTVGLDEFTIGTSDSGLTDAQVVSVAKALNEHFVLGYEQGLQSAGYLFKLTWLLSRRWSIAGQAGTFNGLALLFTQRFD